MAKELKAEFASEAELCATFIKQLPQGWTAFAETAGFDILLVRDVDGAQIGVEAKQTLNAKVVLQAAESRGAYLVDHSGPDFRAVLVPYGKAGSELAAVCRLLSITVIEMKTKVVFQQQQWGPKKKFTPDLPAVGGSSWREDWFDLAPWKRCPLPEYVPDVVAGASAPSTLSSWKISAIKVFILVERTGFVTRTDFAQLKINHRRFLDMGWLQQSDERGKYVLGRYPLNLRAQHPTVYPQIEADFDQWCPKDRLNSPLLQKQEVLL
jgi:hypothetical protein